MGDWRGFLLNLFVFEEIASTQTWLIEQIKKEKNFSLPVCVIAQKQTQGIGSRGNEWESEERAVLFSFAFEKRFLPKDLPLQSLSLYVGILLRDFFSARGSKKLWLKWPNDLYVEEKKAGGILTQSLGEVCVCGVGINLESKKYASLDLSIADTQIQEMICDFLTFFFEYPSWSEIFHKYKLEFHKNFSYYFHYRNQLHSFKDTALCEDGAIMIGDEKIYSLR